MLKIKSERRTVLPLVLVAMLSLAGVTVHAKETRQSKEVLERIKAEKSERNADAHELLRNSRKEFALDEDHDFDLMRSEVDEFGLTHARFQQRYRGLKVWGGQVVTHMTSSKNFHPHTRASVPVHAEDAIPRIDARSAVLRAHHDSGIQEDKGNLATAELIWYPITEREIAGRFHGNKDVDATMLDTKLVHNALAYHLRVGDDDENALKAMDYIIDAISGEILSKWPSNSTQHAVATGARSQYSGVVSINTNKTASGYELRDMLRGSAGMYQNNLVLKYSSPTSFSITDILTDSTNTWGNGLYYRTGDTNPDTFQTAGVDVAFGMAVTWDMLKYVLGRNGIDGAGKAAFAIVHDPNLGDNAVWRYSCSCMRIGDGASSSGYKTLSSIDIVGHEIAHGVADAAASLENTGETAALHEANSDIFGAMAEFYVRGGGYASRSTTIPSTGGDWKLNYEQGATFPRVMYKPSLDYASKDEWSADLILLDPHYGSGPMNRFFYFLAQGATVSGETSSVRLPNGMTGIGNDKAFRIWYRALSYYFTSSTDYRAARQALITAARDLHGAGSAEEQAVWNAMRGVNVGEAWALPATCGLLVADRQIANNTAISSCNATYSLGVYNGDLIEKQSAAPIWSTNTNVGMNSYAVMQHDGNLVVYKSATRSPNSVVWNSFTQDYPDSVLNVQADGNLVINTVTGLPVWWKTTPASAATVVKPAGNNTTPAAAQVLERTSTGIVGRLPLVSVHYYKVALLRGGGAFTTDFVGTRYVQRNKDGIRKDHWEVSILDMAGNVLQTTTTNAATPRVTQTYQNLTGAPQDILLRVKRNAVWGGETKDGSYAVAVKYPW